MALFKRKDNSSVLPDEVSEYYQSQRRERTGVAITLGVVALVVTLLIGAGLFFGGRYAYNKIAGNDEAATTETTTESSNDGTTTLSDDKITANDNDSKQTDSSSTNSTATDEGFGSIELDGGEGPAPDSSSTTQPATGDTQATIPATGDNPPVLPATGDPGR